MTTDLELLERWRTGDLGAGNELFERYFSSICRFFENKLQGDVEELVQATFMACVDNRDQFRAQSSFRTYLFSIARYQLYGHYRRNRRDGERLDFGVTSLVDLGVSPRSAIAADQQHRHLLAALCALPVEQQLLLELHYWEGMDMEELAAIFDINRTTVRTRLFRARQALRDSMAALAEGGEIAEMSVEDLDAWARGLRERHAGQVDR
ncbi:RNA polymerase sigma factor [Haliangium sp.]|uniref:RNA polymerase sigma factor n=1 Tax=Haliangium sp. TaxID=2663208 RepID=UPI003D0C7C62